jgi:multimeric flavodoxin WrbA
MNILAFMGSPRFRGNVDTLLDAFIEGAKKENPDVKVKKINLAAKKITPCIECGECDKTGKCALKDDMTEIYDFIDEADVIVVASPIFFYNITAWTQALVERSQALWVRKYLLKTTDITKRKKGIFLSIGATKGRKLFDGVILVIKYFFDAINADFTGALLFKGVEKKGEINNFPFFLEDTRQLGGLIVKNEDISVVNNIFIP